MPLNMSSNNPPAMSTKVGGRIYSLDVVQQPVRARMCGFGDKDRRPITPPPCVRLIVKDATTERELEVSEINMDFFVLTVDLWSADGSREVNLVRHSATSPSISTAVSSSYPPPPPISTQVSYSYNPASAPQYQTSYTAPVSLSQPGGGPLPPSQHLGHHDPQQHPPHPHLPPHSHHSPHSSQYAHPPHSHHPPLHPHPPPQGYYQGQPSYGPRTQIQQASHVPATQPPGMFTRNLIGSLSASAFRLTDPDMKMGVWFILQDLSVRTEGTFRLKMNFVNVGATPHSPGIRQPSSTSATSDRCPSPSSAEPNPASGSRTPTGHLNTGSAPVLASCFSDVFQVFSAKKFPGVIESTALSKCFATQGIKIPIRKDGPKALSNREEYDNDD